MGKFDLSDVPQELTIDYLQRKKNNYNLKGYKTTSGDWKTFTFTHEMEKTDSIQKDLETARFRERAEKTIYVIHTPPNKTNLDQVVSGNHVGSLALRIFIEKYQPYMTLHSHIHETVDVSGEFKEFIGSTLCMSAGNHNEGSNLAVLVFDLHMPEDARRLII